MFLDIVEKEKALQVKQGVCPACISNHNHIIFSFYSHYHTRSTSARRQFAG